MKENLDEKIKGNSFEVLVGFVQTTNPICTFLLNEINANFKVGVQQPELDAIYNMTIKSEQKDFQFQEFYKLVTHYLDVLNIKSG